MQPACTRRSEAPLVSAPTLLVMHSFSPRNVPEDDGNHIGFDNIYDEVFRLNAQTREDLVTPRLESYREGLTHGLQA